jgi:hypothetical protein
MTMGALNQGFKKIHLKGKGTMYLNFKLFENLSVYSLACFIVVANEL